MKIEDNEEILESLKKTSKKIFEYSFEIKFENFDAFTMKDINFIMKFIKAIKKRKIYIYAIGFKLRKEEDGIITFQSIMKKGRECYCPTPNKLIKDFIKINKEK